jgi:hypothetical protein
MTPEIKIGQPRRGVSVCSYSDLPGGCMTSEDCFIERKLLIV